MRLEWEEFVGPNTLQAKGFGGTYLINNKENSSTLYLMKHGEPLCPITKERSEYSCECLSSQAAQYTAQSLEDRIQHVALKIATKMEEVIEEFSDSASTTEALQDRQP